MIKAQDEIEQQLLMGLLNADPNSVQQLYDLALPSVISWVKENNGNEADARDIFQEALLALYRRLEKGDFTLTCKLKSYLRIICRNLWLTRIRQQKSVSSLSEIEDSIKLDSSIQQQLELTEKRQLFLKHFDQLGESCKKILALFFDKTSLKTIAKQLDTSEGYIKKRKFQCKEKLIKSIKNDPIYQELKNDQ